MEDKVVCRASRSNGKEGGGRSVLRRRKSRQCADRFAQRGRDGRAQKVSRNDRVKRWKAKEGEEGKGWKGWSAQVLQRWLRAQVGGCCGKTVRLRGRPPRLVFVNRLQTVCITASKLCPSLISSPGIHSDLGAPSSDLAPWATVGICPSSTLSSLHAQNPLPRNTFHVIF